MNSLFSSLEDFQLFLRNKIVGVKTGFTAVDTAFMGLRGLVGILGEPKACKSSFVLNVALYNAKHGVPVHYVDRENGKIETIKRAMCAHLRKSLPDLRAMSAEEIVSVGERLASWPLTYSSDADYETMENHVANLIETHGQAILILDSLHALPSATEFESMRSVVDRWIVQLDSLKLRFPGKLTIFLTIEKSRQAYGKAILSGAKESGRIEYKLEQLLDFRAVDDNEVLIECTVNRHGPKGQMARLRKFYSDPSNPYSFTYTFNSLLC